jgi:RES domain-containing protein
MLGDLAMEQGYKGIIFPSMVRAGGTNLVIYKDMLEPEDKLDVFDDGLLPDDRASWSKRDLR